MKDLYDIIIIGGGIGGVGVSIEAKRKGYRTLLLERAEILSATSANSLRIIHGGLRYLQQLNIKRVISSIQAQSELLRLYPEHIKPLRCLFPLERFGARTATALRIAGSVYSVLQSAIGIRGQRPRILAQRECEQIALLRGRSKFGAFEWNDAVIKDLEGFHAHLRTECGEILERCGAAEVRELTNCVEVNLEGRMLSAKVVVDTRGPWANQALSEGDQPFWPIRFVKAFNVVVNRKLDDVAVALRSKNSSRQFFFVPRGDHTAIGTEYYDCDSPEATVSEIETTAFLGEINSLAPELNLAAADVCAIDCGVLPGIYGAAKAPSLIGSERILSKGRVVKVLSTKYTTFLTQARKVLEQAETIF